VCVDGLHIYWIIKKVMFDTVKFVEPVYYATEEDNTCDHFWGQTNIWVILTNVTKSMPSLQQVRLASSLGECSLCTIENIYCIPVNIVFPAGGIYCVG
jgi:hypothetical protein